MHTAGEGSSILNGNENGVISIQNVKKSFGDVRALSGLSLQVAEGETLGLLGPNGSGKTTTVRLLNGIIRPDEGAISVFGLSPEENGQEIRMRTGVVTENAALYENMTPLQNLGFFGELYGLPKSEASAKAGELLELFALGEKKNEKAGALSTGQKKKLAIARALIGDPKILFLDEPTSGLDPEAALGIISLIRDLKSRRVTVFVCTHQLDEAEHYCDRYVFLDKGAALESGTLVELEKKYLKKVVLEIQLAGEYREGAVEYPARWEDGSLLVDLPDAASIPGAIRAFANAFDIASVKRRNCSLSALYFEIRGHAQ